MEREPDYENVVFIDEYPHLTARREVKLALGGLKRIVNNDMTVILPFPEREDTPDGAA
jgi:hypothetical protein